MAFRFWASLIVTSGTFTNAALAAEILIPRSMPGDRGSYFLIESKRVGDVVKALHKRVGPSGVGFTRTETNCRTMLIRDIGYGDGSVDKIRHSPSKWYELVPGSSKSDLANFVCKHPQP